MTTQQIIALASGGLSLFAYALYIYQIWFGNTRPSKSSWWILTVVWTVTFLSSISLSGGESFANGWDNLTTKWLPISYIVGSLFIAISTIWRGQKEPWGKLDYTCVFVAAVSLIFYLTTEQLLLSLLLALCADFFGILPTIKNAWKFPKNEDFTAWTIESIASIISLFAVGIWTLTNESIANWTSPVYLTLVNVVITIFIARQFFSKSANI